MGNRNKVTCVILAFFLVCFPFSGAKCGRGDVFRDTAAAIVKAAKAGDVERICVLGFTARGGAGKDEADYVAERIGAHLAGRKTPALIERALIEKILREVGRSSSIGGEGDVAKTLGELFSVDAVVTGTVFAAGDRLKVVTRLVELRSGRVLLARLADLDREIPGMSVPETPQRWGASPPPDLRDAVASGAEPSCAALRDRHIRLNSGLADAKARYWAVKMREPGFSLRGLTRNPGSEIADPETRARFYSLLRGYYGEEASPALEDGELKALKRLFEEENRVWNECAR